MESGFIFPKVESVYEPSYKTTVAGVFLMFLIGGTISLGGGYFLGVALPKVVHCHGGRTKANN